MDDFTFPAAAAEPADSLCGTHLHLRRRPAFPHFAAPPLWFPSAAAAAAAAVRGVDAVGGVMAAEEPAAAELGGELARRAGAADEEERMDLLWENFNEELEALRRAGSCSRADSAGGGGMEAASDTDSEAAAGRCAPMLRPSSRAGGTGHYRRTSWVLLMRIFRRLFVVEKTISAARKQARAL